LPSNSAFTALPSDWFDKESTGMKPPESGQALCLSLTYPPSANRLWRNVDGKTLKSREYRAWIDENLLRCKLQRSGSVSGTYHLTVEVDRPDRRARDLDNLLKPASDLLAAAGVIGNDSDCLSIFAKWGSPEPVKPALVRVTVQAAA
jgi:crossover junction endodeoxyribonuclease RusA